MLEHNLLPDFSADAVAAETELPLAAAAIEVECHVRRGPDRQQAKDDDQAGHPAFEKRQQRPEEPDQQRQDGDADETQHPTRGEEPQSFHD